MCLNRLNMYIFYEQAACKRGIRIVKVLSWVFRHMFFMLMTIKYKVYCQIGDNLSSIQQAEANLSYSKNVDKKRF